MSCWLLRRDESKVSEHALVDNTPLDTKSLLLLPSQARHYLHNGHAFEGVVYFLTNSHQKQASRDAHTMFGVCWLHLLFCMFVVLSAAVVPRSLVVVVVGVGVVMVVQPNGNRIE